MTRPYNTKHFRAKSKYPERLAKRGLGRAPVMSDLDALRRKQGAEEVPDLTSKRKRK